MICPGPLGCRGILSASAACSGSQQSGGGMNADLACLKLWRLSLHTVVLDSTLSQELG